MNITEVDSFLEHHGVKGMHWGVTTPEDNTSKTSLSPLEKKVIANANKQGLTEDRAKKLFGPDSNKSTSSGFNLTDGQKKALKFLIIYGGITGALLAVGVHSQNKQLITQLGEFGKNPKLINFWKENQKLKGINSAINVKSLSQEGVNLPKGTIVKRISTENETLIKDQFFAAYKPEDVNRYKAVLPVYWKIWGSKSNSGYVVNLRADTDIKAPSPKEAFDTFVDVIIKNNKTSGISEPPSRTLANAKRIYRETAVNFVDPNAPFTKDYFDLIKSKGYNAIVDFNDAGNFADTPLQFLNGSMFKNVGNEVLSNASIRAAQDNLVALVHAIFEIIKEGKMPMTMTPYEFLEHHGVKGMHWGVTTPESSKSSKRTKSISEDSKKVQALKKRPRSSLTNAELRTVNDRLNLEQQYNKLSPKKIALGEQKAKTILASAATITAVYTLATSPLGQKAIALGRKLIKK